MFAISIQIYSINKENSCEELQRDSTALNEWSHKSQMEFNAGKCHTIRLGKVHKDLTGSINLRQHHTYV